MSVCKHDTLSPCAVCYGEAYGTRATPGALVKYWAWANDVKNLGSWPGEEYTGHNTPVEMYEATDVEQVLQQAEKAVRLWRSQNAPREGAAFRVAMRDLEATLKGRTA